MQASRRGLSVFQGSQHGRSQIVIEHDYTSLDAFRKERAAFHDDPGSVGEVLARLSELAVPGTATEFEFDGVELAGAAE